VKYADDMICEDGISTGEAPTLAKVHYELG